ncbi:MAG: hypothetical protein ACRDYC_07405 [Acidimicrobiales bacterium]
MPCAPLPAVPAVPGGTIGCVRRYLTPRCIGMHVTILVVLPLFAWLTWWQFGRATGGNTLSWAYTFEWPLFAGYAIYMWWQLIHDVATVVDRSPRGGGRSGRSDGGGARAGGPEDVPGWALGRSFEPPPVVEGGPVGAGSPGRHEEESEEDEELVAYNRYLTSLASQPARKRW